MTKDYFVQQPPMLLNPFDNDVVLQQVIKLFVPNKYHQSWFKVFQQFGEKILLEVEPLGNEAETTEPVLINYDAWGRRIDRVQVPSAWYKLKDFSSKNALVSDGYQREFGEYSRIYQFVKLFLFTPSSAIYTCPLAMTDGAARLLEVYGDNSLRNTYFQRYISTDPTEFYGSGQWMTEKTGGSDVSETETIAEFDGETWRLTGPKWFTSGITEDTAMTLAKIKEGHNIDDKVSLFVLEIYNDDGEPNNLTIDKLKDKLGTRALPTAELTLNGVPSKLIGERGRGVKQIATMLNITRVYNAISAVSYLQRALSYAEDYSSKRKAFGSLLKDLPLHSEILTETKSAYLGNLILTMWTVSLLGKTETGVASDQEEKLLRLLTPVTKLYTAKKSFAYISEMIEAIGGIGYLEDAGFPKLLRDAQVFTIWEGTTNVLSLDLLRVFRKEGNLNFWIDTVKPNILNSHDQDVISQFMEIEAALKSYLQTSSKFMQKNARNLSFEIARFSILSLLFENKDDLSELEDIEEYLQFWITPSPEFHRLTSQKRRILVSAS